MAQILSRQDQPDLLRDRPRSAQQHEADWAAQQPGLAGDNAAQPVVEPRLNSDSGPNPDGAETPHTDYG